MRYFIHLAYNGKNYHGWQLQKNAISVQQVLNDTLSTFFRQEIETVGAGRTDTGVHAKCFYAHFDLNNGIEIDNIKSVVGKLNSFLDKSIVIYNIFKVRENAHARFDAISRTYQYIISTEKNPFDYCFSYYYNRPLDDKIMNEAAEILFNHTDFSCFSKSNTQVKTNNCKIMEAKWIRDDNKLIFTIKADRFLRNMVRAIVGTIIDVGSKKISLADFNKIIESRKRTNAGYSVPAHALYLIDIEYPEDIFIKSIDLDSEQRL